MGKERDGKISNKDREKWERRENEKYIITIERFVKGGR